MWVFFNSFHSQSHPTKHTLRHWLYTVLCGWVGKCVGGEPLPREGMDNAKMKLPRFALLRAGQWHTMRLLAKLISSVIGDLGFCLITFERGEKRNSDLMNYISNGNREDMIKALKELTETLEKGTDFMTPDEN